MLVGMHMQTRLEGTPTKGGLDAYAGRKEPCGRALGSTVNYLRLDSRGQVLVGTCWRGYRGITSLSSNTSILSSSIYLTPYFHGPLSSLLHDSKLITNRAQTRTSSDAVRV